VILWVMDCYPEVAIMAGMLTPRGIPARGMRWVNRRIVNRCHAVVCLDGAMKRFVEGYRTRPSIPEVVVIPNWERAEDFPETLQGEPWEGIARLGLNGKLIVLYLGNAGQGHTFETVLEAAEKLKNEPIRFLFVGGGARWKWLEEESKNRSLSNMILHDYVPKYDTPKLMASCHCALITLRDEAVGLISPSKMHSNLAAGLPIVYVGPPGRNLKSTKKPAGRPERPSITITAIFALCLSSINYSRLPFRIQRSCRRFSSPVPRA
jgi:colanic acid biosynthesis glycosyl transferase WcaI